MATWIDFRELRERLDFAAVLRHYGVEPKLKPSGQHHGFCPLPTHQGHKRSPSFSAHLPRKVFHCFGCGARGNVLDFAVRMENLDPDSPDHVRRVALLLAEAFAPDVARTSGVNGKPPGKAAAVPTPPTPKPPKPAEAQENADRADTRPALVNVPLDFELRHLDPRHPYLKERGFTIETVAHFGLGYCPRGLMQGRIAIPLHDRRGRLVGYAGRLVDDRAVGEDTPKYLFPGTRLHNGRSSGFHKSLLLYNGFAIAGPVSDLIVVEGFPSVWWLWQAGFPSVVALMGSDCSDRQAALIIRGTSPDGRVWIFPDGDDAGRRCAEKLLVRIAAYRFARWLRLDDGQQPTDLSAENLVHLFGGDATRVTKPGVGRLK